MEAFHNATLWNKQVDNAPGRALRLLHQVLLNDVLDHDLQILVLVLFSHFFVQLEKWPFD
jgi:hypothetical protein